MRFWLPKLPFIQEITFQKSILYYLLEWEIIINQMPHEQSLSKPMIQGWVIAFPFLNLSFENSPISPSFTIRRKIATASSRSRLPSATIGFPTWPTTLTARCLITCGWSLPVSSPLWRLTFPEQSKTFDLSRKILICSISAFFVYIFVAMLSLFILFGINVKTTKTEQFVKFGSDNLV